MNVRLHARQGANQLTPVLPITFRNKTGDLRGCCLCMTHSVVQTGWSKEPLIGRF
jgi:hypothetical protein